MNLQRIPALVSFLLTTGVPLLAAPAEKQPLLVKTGEYHLQRAREGAAVVARDRFIYVTGGGSRDGVHDIERFDSRTHQSVRIFDGLAPRRYHNAIEHAGKIYLFGGQGIAVGNQPFESSVEIFDCTKGTLERGTPMPVPRAHMAAAKFGDKVFLAGGTKVIERRGVQLVPANDVDVYDLATGRWSAAAPLPTARECAGVSVGNFLVAAGGFRANRADDTVEVLDPQANAWRALPPLARKVSAHSVAFLDRYVFLFGDYGKLSSVLAYDLKTRESFEVASDFKGVRHTAAATLGDAIYVVGGIDANDMGESDLIQVFTRPREAAR